MTWLRSLFGNKPSSTKKNEQAPKKSLTVEQYASTMIHLLETTEPEMQEAMLKPLLQMMIVSTDAEFRSKVYESIKSQSPGHLNTVLKTLQTMRNSR
jgi:hypothetical protein